MLDRLLSSKNVIGCIAILALILYLKDLVILLIDDENKGIGDGGCMFWVFFNACGAQQLVAADRIIVVDVFF